MKMNTKNQNELRTILERHAYAPELNKLQYLGYKIDVGGCTDIASAKTVARKKYNDFFKTVHRILAIDTPKGRYGFSGIGFAKQSLLEQAKELREVYGKGNLCFVHTRY